MSDRIIIVSPVTWNYIIIYDMALDGIIISLCINYHCFDPESQPKLWKHSYYLPCLASTSSAISYESAIINFTFHSFLDIKRRTIIYINTCINYSCVQNLLFFSVCRWGCGFGDFRTRQVMWSHFMNNTVCEQCKEYTDEQWVIE